MAKETYKIVINEDFLYNEVLLKSGTALTGKSLDDVMDFKMENFEFKSSFTIESEQPKISTRQAGEIIRKTDSELWDESKDKFIDKLTAREIASVREGKKKICHNQQIGFYLRLMSSKPEVDEIHISLHEVKSKERKLIYSAMKAYLMGNSDSSWSTISGRIVSYNNDLFNEEDLKEIVEDLFKGKC